MKPYLDSAYICIRDMDRAIKFWEEFLEQKITIKDDIFSIFDLGNFRLCLFNPEKVKEKVIYGDNCLLSFKVRNIEQLKAKLERLGVDIVYPVTKIGDNFVLEFKDTEGNDVEVYSPITNSKV